jgi:hypothetical protein
VGQLLNPGRGRLHAWLPTHQQQHGLIPQGAGAEGLIHALDHALAIAHIVRRVLVSGWEGGNVNEARLNEGKLWQVPLGSVCSKALNQLVVPLQQPHAGICHQQGRGHVTKVHAPLAAVQGPKDAPLRPAQHCLRQVIVPIAMGGAAEVKEAVHVRGPRHASKVSVHQGEGLRQGGDDGHVGGVHAVHDGAPCRWGHCTGVAVHKATQGDGGGVKAVGRVGGAIQLPGGAVNAVVWVWVHIGALAGGAVGPATGGLHIAGGGCGIHATPGLVEEAKHIVKTVVLKHQGDDLVHPPCSCGREAQEAQEGSKTQEAHSTHTEAQSRLALLTQTQSSKFSR